MFGVREACFRKQKKRGKMYEIRHKLGNLELNLQFWLCSGSQVSKIERRFQKKGSGPIKNEKYLIEKRIIRS